MGAIDKPLSSHVFQFAGGLHRLDIECRRTPQEVARVSQTLQLDVDELFSSVLDFSWGPPSAAPPAEPAPPPQQQQQPQQPAPDSKRLCGNVAADQPDLIGLDVWPAAVALCEYLSAAPGLVAGATVCELGAGMGLPGLLAAQLGAAHVLLTDYEPAVVEVLARNAARNGVAARCATLALDWFDLAPLAPEQRRAFDLLLLADVIYAAAVVQPLVATLRALLRQGAGAALVAHRRRRPLVFDRVDRIARLQEHDEIFEEFRAACAACGLHERLLSDSPAAQAGDEPLLLVIGADPEQLRRFPERAGESVGTTAAGRQAGEQAAGSTRREAAAQGGQLDPTASEQA